MTEQQPYEILERYPAFELRRYPSHVVAEVHVRGSFEGAGNTAFRALFRYITGRNRSGTVIAMTAPVVQEPTAVGSWIVSFVMPDGMTLESMPRPAGSRVSLRNAVEHMAAALRFSGYTSTARVTEKERQLRAVLAENGIEVTGPVRIARFDPPWKPGFLRHNEVVLPIAR